jgi:hypothetical protein
VTWYTFFKSLHVVGAVIWVGGAAALQILAFRIIRTGDATRQAEFAKDAEFVGTRAFIPASWVLLLSGIGSDHGHREHGREADRQRRLVLGNAVRDARRRRARRRLVPLLLELDEGRPAGDPVALGDVNSANDGVVRRR